MLYFYYYYGFFSFAAEEGMDITFSAVGFKKAHFIIPDTCNEKRYSMIQILFLDTVMLREAIIYSWPTREQFRQAFLNMDNLNDDIARAQKNLAKEEMEIISMNMGMSGRRILKIPCGDIEQNQDVLCRWSSTNDNYGSFKVG